ncbi:MAG: LicD family protein [Candidatus Cloacimonadota bacterium]|nr:LicD family protein [Candidatus Cloacimonadota bacterium]
MNKHKKFNTKIFKSTYKILNKHNIPFWLESGSLLGIIRDNKSIHEHKYIDIGIPGEYFDKFMKLKNQFVPFYRIKQVIDLSKRKWIPNDFPKAVILKKLIKSKYAGQKIRVTFKYKKDDKYIWVDKRSCKWVSSHFFEKLDKININGMEICVPGDVKNYLTARYGNWKTVNKNWLSSIDDLSIVDSETISKISPKDRIRKHTKKPIKLEGKYYNRMKRLILFAIKILEKNNIPYWMDEGTLLGIVRDGDLLPWDHDADMGVPGEYAEKLWKIRYQFFPVFFVVRKMASSSWVPGKLRNMKLKPPFERIAGINLHIDLFFKYKVGDRQHWIIMNALKHSESKFFDKLDTTTWEGRKVNIPSNVKEYLRLNYGKWEVPDPNFDPSIDNGTIAEKGFK